MLVRVGPLKLRLLSDAANSTMLNYFSRATLLAAPTATPDVSLWFLSRTSELVGASMLGEPDKTSRARYFRSGYYVTDHFGPPLTVWSKPGQIIVVGETAEDVLWPYFVKYLLLRYTVDHGGLFLKAGVLAIDGRGVLVVGQGNAGKTVFMTNMALHGCQFVSNSHAIVNAGIAHGVASAIRMRACPGVDLSTIPSRPALDHGEKVIDPLDIFGYPAVASVPVDHVCIVNFRAPGVHEIAPLSAGQAAEVMAQFAFGVNVYRLEEDLLDHLGANHAAFADVMRRMMSELNDLAASVSCHVISSDVTKPRYRDEIRSLLTSSGSESVCVR